MLPVVANWGWLCCTDVGGWRGIPAGWAAGFGHGPRLRIAEICLLVAGYYALNILSGFSVQPYYCLPSVEEARVQAASDELRRRGFHNLWTLRRRIEAMDPDVTDERFAVQASMRL